MPQSLTNVTQSYAIDAHPATTLYITTASGVASRSIAEAALMEWHPATSSQDPPCVHPGGDTRQSSMGEALALIP
jgi:hypothetical protein